MTQALWGVLLLSLATAAQGETQHSGTSARQSDQPTAERRAAPTAGRTGASGQTRTSGTASERYKSDLAECRRLTGAERSNCERETRAAKAEGLYRE